LLGQTLKKRYNATVNPLQKSVFFANFLEQRKTIETLLEESHTGSTFYVFLSFSAFITTLGLLSDNALIIVGGILVAPLLYPVLALGMGVATSSKEAIMRSLRIILKSAIFIFLISLLTSFILDQEQVVTRQILLTSSPDFLFFLIAFASGIIASFSWVKQNQGAALPAVAMSVTILPPLATVGIGLSLFDRDVLAGALLMFILNVLGILLASIIMFSLFGFSRMQHIEEEIIKEEEEEIRAKKALPEASA
jgi:uncharacterized hydrophobic protein (TIGR00271 family)